MKRPAFCCALMLWVPQYSCHKPTPQEDYVDARRCFAALDVNLQLLPSIRFEQVGLNRRAVEMASQENMGAAYDAARKIGISPGAVLRDLEGARSSYLKAHIDQKPGGGRNVFHALGGEVNHCLEDFYGQPND